MAVVRPRPTTDGEEAALVEPRSDVPDWLVVHGPADGSPVQVGYRLVFEAADGTTLWARGAGRTRVGASAEASTVLCGLTLEDDPLARLDDLTGGGEPGRKADPMALVGHFAAATLDREGEVTVVTDHVASVPVYHAPSASSGGRVLGTSIDDVARLAGRTAIDAPSAAEFAHMGTVTAPYTIFDSVLRVEPGSVCRSRPDGPLVDERYWEPPAEDAQVDVGDVAPVLLSTMRSNIATLVAGRRPMLFMSGGEDSRVLAALVREQLPEGARLPASIFLDRRNREWRLARTAARLIGVDLDVLLRAPDHYTAHMATAAAITGSGYDLLHAHSIGLVDPGEADLFLDGYTADLFYKATFQSVAQRRVGGVAVSVDHPDHSRTSTVDPAWPDTEVGREVARRRRDRRRRVGEVRTPRSVETWVQGWPIADRATFPFFLSNWRSRPTASPFMLGSMLDLVAVVPEDAKINRALFHRTFGPVMGRSGWVPRSGGQIPALGGRSAVVPAAVIRSAGLVARRLRPRRDGVGDGPWQTSTMLDRASDDAFASVPDDVLAEIAAMVDRSDVDEGPAWSALRASHERQRVLQLTTLVRSRRGA